jgi:predicted RNA-binding Zn-ribbon protein involved in translation (DUF1610 family)
MELSQRVYEKCECCGRNGNIKQYAVFGCDQCGKVIGDEDSTDSLGISVHWLNNNSERYQLCSWECVFKMVKKAKTDWFISLPFLSMDNHTKGQRVSDFWKAVKAIK